MIKKCLIASLLILALSCPAFAHEWDGITYQVQTQNIVFQFDEDAVVFYTEYEDVVDNIMSITDEDDYYKIILDSDRFIMLDKNLDHGKVAIDNTLYMFHEE